MTDMITVGNAVASGVLLGIIGMFSWMLLHTVNRDLHLNGKTKYVSADVCYERTKRIEGKIDHVITILEKGKQV